MSFFGKSFSDMYNGFRTTISDVFKGVQSGVGMIKQAKDWISEHVDKLSAIPFVGDVLKEGIDKVANEPIFFGASLRDFGNVIDLANKYVNSPYINEAAGFVDQFLSGAANRADQVIQAGSAG